MSYLMNHDGDPRITRALGIRGWMSEVELLWLASAAAGCARVVEIGSAWGRSTRALGDNCPGRIWAVDTWEGDSAAAQKLDEQVTWNDNTASHQYRELGGDSIFAAFRSNLTDLIAAGVVLPIRMTSVAAAKCVPIPNDLDLVFIDGSHDAASVRADIAAWMPKLRSGGVLAGHDYSGLPWHEVKQVVDATFAPGDLTFCETIWWARKA